MQKISMVLGSLLLCTTLYAKDNAEKIGDILQIAIPLGAYGTTLYLDDKEGQTEFYKSYGVSLASTYALKYTVRAIVELKIHFLLDILLLLFLGQHLSINAMDLNMQ